MDGRLLLSWLNFRSRGNKQLPFNKQFVVLIWCLILDLRLSSSGAHSILSHPARISVNSTNFEGFYNGGLWENIFWIYWSISQFLTWSDTERDNPYYFFPANQPKARTKIYSLTHCSLTVNECDWHILVGNDERINSHYLTRIQTFVNNFK